MQQARTLQLRSSYRAMASRLSGDATSATTMPGAVPPLSEAASASSLERSRPAMAQVLHKRGQTNQSKV